jgi:hypothetical protein
MSSVTIYTYTVIKVQDISAASFAGVETIQSSGTGKKPRAATGLQFASRYTEDITIPDPTISLGRPLQKSTKD